MSKTVKMLITILAIILIATTIMPNMVMAAKGDKKGESTGDLINDLFDQKADGKEGITETGGKIVDIITTIGIVVAVIVLLVLGIKYMMGSASEKAEYKKTMIPYLVGALLIFGASAIAKAIVSLSAGIAGN